VGLKAHPTIARPQLALGSALGERLGSTLGATLGATLLGATLSTVLCSDGTLGAALSADVPPPPKRNHQTMRAMITIAIRSPMIIPAPMPDESSFLGTLTLV
jgi:hypothetical protein